jgi:hypothetical protein
VSKIAKNYGAFKAGLEDHDKRNPDHNANGIGLSAHDMERLGFEEGESLWGSITIQQDSGVSGNFRVLCDGHHFDHDQEETEELVVDADANKRHEVTVGTIVSREVYEQILWGTT